MCVQLCVSERSSLLRDMINLTTIFPFFFDLRTNLNMGNIKNSLFNFAIVEVTTKRQNHICFFTSKQLVRTT